jgi:oxygen-independent coproporphyrinogen-3 oxidase
MWTLAELEEVGLDLEPAHNSFTYTFPPPYYAKEAGKNGRPKSLSLTSGWSDLSLYFHIPFCRMDCSFCSLHRQVVRNEASVSLYLSALQKEIRSFKPYFMAIPVTSIYFGGGTPSILSSSQIGQLLNAVEESFCLATSVEVCIECAPDINRSRQDWQTFLQSLLSRTSLPISRVSLGIQSFDKKTLRSMGRRGGFTSVMNLLYVVDELLPVYNVDVIIGYPEQPSGLSTSAISDKTVSAVEELLSQNFRLPSLSLYQLWDTETIPVTQRRFSLLPQKQILIPAKWRLQRGLYELGYEPSLVSTFVRRKQFEHLWAKHRHISFRQIGMGSGAYSILPREFLQRTRDIDGYITRMQTTFETYELDCCYTLTNDEEDLRRIIMGLRTREWIAIPPIDSQMLTPKISGEIVEKITKLTNLGVLERRNNSVRLSQKAFIIANEVSSFLHPQSHLRKPRM